MFQAKASLGTSLTPHLLTLCGRSVRHPTGRLYPRCCHLGPGAVVSTCIAAVDTWLAFPCFSQSILSIAAEQSFWKIIQIFVVPLLSIFQWAPFSPLVKGSAFVSPPSPAQPSSRSPGVILRCPLTLAPALPLSWAPPFAILVAHPCLLQAFSKPCCGGSE